MSILLLEGFDDGLWDNRLGGTLVSGNVDAAYGLHGKGARVGDTANYSIEVSFGIVRHTIGFAFKVVAAAVAQHIMMLHDTDYYVNFDPSGSRLHLHINLVTDIDWYTPVGSVVIGEWHYFEIETYWNSSNVGVCKWWLDGTLIDSDTAIDFQYAIPTFWLIGGTGGNDIDDMYVDDLYLTDTSGSANTANLGPIEIETLLPSGNGNSSVMVGSDADSTDNYLLVDNNASTPPATTEYVGSATEGDKDTYAFGDLTGTPTVVGMVASLYAAKTDSGAKFMRPIVRTGSTDYPGDSEGLAETYSLHEHTWDENPNTTSAWTYGEVNGMEVGQEVRDS